MNSSIIQDLRYKLQRRTRRINSLDHKVFHFGLKQYWEFLCNNYVISAIMEELEKKKPEVLAEVNKILSGEVLVFDSEIENAAASLFVIKKCVESPDQNIESAIGFRYSHETKFNDSINYFRDMFLEPLYDYIDEHLDEGRAILAILKRYKHQCEWFRRDTLLSQWAGDTQRGEKSLCHDLYAYLFEQGLDFVIEPQSASGRADLISAQIGEDRLIADVKVFHADTSKTYLLKAFNQVYIYTRDYNQAFGYLIIFKHARKILNSLWLQWNNPSPAYLIMGRQYLFSLLTFAIIRTQRQSGGFSRLLKYLRVN